MPVGIFIEYIFGFTLLCGLGALWYFKGPLFMALLLLGIALCGIVYGLIIHLLDKSSK